MDKKIIKLISIFSLSIFILFSCGFEETWPCDPDVPECGEPEPVPKPDTEG
jgi:hypothetical protein|tara:strand:+ start:65 stop:217 length:153 start_codon:yes stop_codon:yes gene_type:complete